MFKVESFLILGVFLIWARGEDSCFPQQVENLSLTNTTLSWTVAQNESCDIVKYIVHITQNETISFVYEVEEENLDVSFLEICPLYNFSVTPVADHATGRERVILARIASIPYDNYTITDYNVTTTDEGIFVYWDIDGKEEKCINSFRVVVWDADGPPHLDEIIEENFLNLTSVLYLVPCEIYIVGIRSMYFEPKTQGPEAIVLYVTPGIVSNPPIPITMYQGTTSFNITWKVDSLGTNRCHIIELLIESPGNFNLTFPYTDIDATPRDPIITFIGDLEPYTTYETYVSVLNAVGKSEPNILYLPTLPSTDD